MYSAGFSVRKREVHCERRWMENGGGGANFRYTMLRCKDWCTKNEIEKNTLILSVVSSHSSSMSTSVIPSVSGNIAVSGDICFSTDYNYKTTTLEVRIKGESTQVLNARSLQGSRFLQGARYLLGARSLRGARFIQGKVLPRDSVPLRT